MSHPKDRYAVVILSAGKIVRIAGRFLSFREAIARLDLYRTMPIHDGVPAVTPHPISRAILRAKSRSRSA